MKLTPSVPFSLTSLFFLCLFAVLSLGGCQNYDKLVEQDQICEQKWGDLDAQLQRRYELIPNIVNTVKGAAKQEESTLAKVTEARAAATGITLKGEDFTDPAKMEAFQKAQDQLRGSLSRLLVASENYPQLQSQGGFHDLRVELEGTENRILRAREQYNEAVKNFNTALGQISGQVVNKATGKPFKARVYFKAASADAQVAPKVSF